MDSRQTVEAWRDAHQTSAWLFAAARVLGNWAIGQEVTEEAYKATVESAGNVEIGYRSIRS